MLQGRERESAVVAALLDGVRTGRSGVLVVHGEAGVGKTALLDHVLETAGDVQVARAVGVESEIELAFAALHQLCGPMLEHLDKLPEPQRDALGTAFGLHLGRPPDRFHVGVAVLSLLSEVAAQRPLVCVIDDAQWLDQASALTVSFVARRLLAESVVIVLAARQPGPELRGFPELVVEGLRDSDARELLRRTVSWRLDEPVRERLIAECQGNPLALLELSRGLSAGELAGFSRPDTLATRIEGSFLNRCQSLPEPTRMLLIIAAAEPAGDAVLIRRAATRLGIPMDAAAPAADAGLFHLGAAARFHHPLVRSAVYRAASPDDRRMAHHALAGATDPEVDPDRWAWHRSQAASDPDDEVATELERSAGRAQARGGLAAASAFLRRSAELTVDPAVRAARALEAAKVSHEAGAYQLAQALLAMAEELPLNELHHAAVELQRAHMAFASSRDAPGLLLAAARRWEPLAPAVARDTYLHALSAGLFTGRLARGVGVGDVARAALAAPPASGRPSDLLLEGLAGVIAHGHAAGAPLLKQVVRAFRSLEVSTAQVDPWLLWLAAHAAGDLWDDEGWDDLNAREISLARQVGALRALPIALTVRITIHLFAGELDLAASLASEIAGIAEATGTRMNPFGAIAVAAFQGREAETTDMLRAAREDLQPRGAGVSLTLLNLSAAVLYNGLGRYQEALLEAQQGAEYSDELSLALWCLPELIEAAVRVGEPGIAAGALERLAQTTGPSGTDWALGIEARSRALLSEGEGAERLYREAIERLGRSRFKAHLARAHLLYGEWLRRDNRRDDARGQLRAAHDMLTAMGIAGFAQQARAELVAAGETVRRRPVETAHLLTPQELQIARLARDGFSNSEIGAQLFVSARTVEWHLGKVYTKLGITSRKGLKETTQLR